MNILKISEESSAVGDFLLISVTAVDSIPNSLVCCICDQRLHPLFFPLAGCRNLADFTAAAAATVITVTAAIVVLLPPPLFHVAFKSRRT